MMKTKILFPLIMLYLLIFNVTHAYAAPTGNQIFSMFTSGQTAQATNALASQAGISNANASQVLNGLGNLTQLNKLTSGGAGNLLSGIMSGQTGGAGSIGNITNMLQTLQSGQISPSAITGLVNQVAGGAIPADVGKALSGLNLGNISNPQQLLSNPAVSNLLANQIKQLGLPAPAAELVGNVLKSGLSPQGLQQAATQAVMQQALASLPAPLKEAITAVMGGGDPAKAAAALAAAAAGEATPAATPPAANPSVAAGSSAAAPAGGNCPGAGSSQGCPGSEPYDFPPGHPRHKPKCKDAPVPGNADCGCSAPCCQCKAPIENNHIKIRKHVTEEFIKHRNWMIDIFFVEHILPAMMQMTSQLSVVSMQQVQMIGTMFDAKHQLETQRLFQQLMAEAHKDYQPSEGMCEIGTLTRSLAASSRKTDLGHAAFANRVIDRQLRNGDTISSAEENSDLHSRLDMLVKNHCNKADNSNGLNHLCAKGGSNKERMNKDVDYTRTVESELTLDIDFTAEGMSEEQPDAEDLFALTANLFGHEVLPFIPRLVLATNSGKPRAAAHRYMDLRSVAAKRSVAQNSFTAMAAERAKGDKEVAKYLKKAATELGLPEKNIDEILGKEPSYFAQMEILTKDLYQNPVFYTELYDKPANVLRKTTAMRALNLMQERDLYRSQLRSEAALAVMLESMLYEEHNRVSRILGDLEPEGKSD